jgi:hypothetical protein
VLMMMLMMQIFKTKFKKEILLIKKLFFCNKSKQKFY